MHSEVLLPRRRAEVLVAIPAHNEAPTIERVVQSVRAAVPHFDLMVVDDGSTDETKNLVARLDAAVVTHPGNAGYGATIRTAMRYAQQHGYQTLITFDADGQHRAQDLQPLYEAFRTGSYDLLIGSRFVTRRSWAGVSVLRRAGMQLFSAVIRLVAGRRIYDISSGLRVMSANAIDVLAAKPSVDFHAEAIVYLSHAGMNIGEFPITVEPRRYGRSMYGATAALSYPLKVLRLIAASARPTEVAGK